MEPVNAVIYKKKGISYHKNKTFTECAVNSCTVMWKSFPKSVQPFAGMVYQLHCFWIMKPLAMLLPSPPLLVCSGWDGVA
jgi:hypothetical protein